MVVIKNKFVLASLLLMLTGACQSPFLVFPGKEIKGQVSTVTNFAFAADYTILKLETRPEDPYSVFLRVTVINENLYIDAAPSRRWHAYIRENKYVRVQLGDLVYPARAVAIDDPDIITRFLKGRTIYRIVPN